MDRIEQLIEGWLDYLISNQGRAPSTGRKYRQYLHEFVAYCRERASDPARPSQDMLSSYSGPYLHRRGLDALSRKPVIAALRGFYTWLHRNRITEVNHAALLESPKAGKRLPRPMALSVAEKLIWAPDLDTFIGIRDAAILATLMGCGLRVAGVVGLNESALLFEKDGDKEVLSIRVLEKGSKERIVPAPDEARLLLRAYLGHRELEDIDRALPDGDTVLFVNVRNRRVPSHAYRGESRRLSDWAVRDMITRYCEKAGLPADTAHPHAIRHLYGTELAESDVPEAVRQMLMGHEDANSTKIYTHLASRKARAAAAAANPLAKIRTPVSDLLRRLSR